jgi:hypothetical protein
MSSRRFCSLYYFFVAANPIEQAAPPLVDEADSPLLSHAPGSILRRSARTKIRKTSLPGDGGGHRFPTTRRTRVGAEASAGVLEDADRRVSASSLASSDGEISNKEPHRFSPSRDNHARTTSTESAPDVYGGSRDSFISTSSEADDRPVRRSLSPERQVSGLPAPSPPPSSPPRSKAGRETTPPTIVAPQPIAPPSPTPLVQVQEATPQSEDHLNVPSSARIKRAPSPGTEEARAEPPSDSGRSESVSPTPSPDGVSGEGDSEAYEPQTPANVHPQYPSLPAGAALLPPQLTRPISPPRERPSSLKGRKSGWARLGLSRLSHDDGGEHEEKEKKSKKDKKVSKSVDEVSSKAETKDKDSGFFGGLFGTKKRHDHSELPSQAQPTQVAISPTASGMLGQGGRYMNFYRLPIHVERAVYRLSHIKLANPRRPLYEQVLISNLMFWYLSVINKPTNSQAATKTSGPTTSGDQIDTDVNHGTDVGPMPKNQDGRDIEQVGQTTPEYPAPAQAAPGPKKSLTKHGPDTRRRAEVAVRPAQYGPNMPVDQDRSSSDPRPHPHPPPSSSNQSSSTMIRERDPAQPFRSSIEVEQPASSSVSSSSGSHFVPVPITTRPPDDSGFQVMRPRRRAPSPPLQIDRTVPERPSDTTPRPQIDRIVAEQPSETTPSSAPAPSASSSTVLDDFDFSEHAWLASVTNLESPPRSTANGNGHSRKSPSSEGDPLDIISSYSVNDASAAVVAAAAAAKETQARRQRSASLRKVSMTGGEDKADFRDTVHAPQAVNSVGEEKAKVSKMS